MSDVSLIVRAPASSSRQGLARSPALDPELVEGAEVRSIPGSPDLFVVTVPDNQARRMRRRLGRSGMEVSDNPVYSIPPVRGADGRVIDGPLTRPERARSFTLQPQSSAADPMAKTREAHGADQLHARGITGEGVHVFVVGTGIDDHVQLEGQLGTSRDFAEPEFDGQFYDPNGHETHVAGIVNAVAPGATIHNVRVLDGEGSGDQATLLEALNYIAAEVRAMEARGELDTPVLVAMSLGGPRFAFDPLTDRVEQLQRELPIIFSISAGNSGPGVNTLTSPADAEGVNVMAVTAGSCSASSGDRYSCATADFSSRGGKAGMPDVEADGVLVRSTIPGDAYASFSGTSMAQPANVGALALLLELARKSYRSGELNESPFDLAAQGVFTDALRATAVDDGDLDHEEGYGAIWIPAAASQLLAFDTEGLPPLRELVVPEGGGIGLIDIIGLLGPGEEDPAAAAAHDQLERYRQQLQQ